MTISGIFEVREPIPLSKQELELILEIRESLLPEGDIRNAKRTCAEKVSLQSNEGDEIFNGEMTIDADAAFRANKSCYVGEIKRKYNFSQNGESFKRIGPHFSADSEHEVKRMLELLIKYKPREL